MWYVIQVRGGREYEVLTLCEQAVKEPSEEFFIMRCLKFYHNTEGQWEKKERKAFPGYIFVDTHDVNSLRERLRTIPDLTKVLGTGDEIIPIYQEEEEFLRNLGGDDHLIPASHGYREGDDIIITEGALVDQEKRVKWVNIHKRVICVDIDFAGETHELKLAFEQITKPE